MQIVAVVGGGIAGLAAAHRLIERNADLRVIVLEASARVGGKLRRTRVGGCWVDVGAEAMLARRPEGVELAVSAGLGADLIHPVTSSALLRNRGRNVALPARTLLGIPSDTGALTDLLDESSRRQIDTEPGNGPYPELAGDVSVGSLVRQRFGGEVVDRLVDPLLGGVYAGRADDISLQMAIPALSAALTEHGSSLLDTVRALVPGPGAASTSPVFASIAGGLARLPETLAADPRISVRTSSTVRLLRRSNAAFELTLGSAAAPEVLRADAVILATPAAKSAGILADLVPSAAVDLAGIEAAGVVIVTLAFPAPAELPAGSGILIPEVEALPVKAMTFSSQKWPGIGEESDVTLVRGSLGRAGDQRDLQRTDAELISIVRAGFAEVTGLRADPVDAHVQRWGGGLPQYRTGHRQRVERIRAVLDPIAGLAVCGASYDGVGIPACIASARAAADRVLAAMPT